MSYIRNPYIPEKDAKLFLIDIKAKNYSDVLKRSVFSFSSNKLQKPVSTHPDMTFCHLGMNYAVVEKNSFKYYNELLKKYDFHIIQGKNYVDPEYPKDIALNCVIINGILFHRLDSTDKAVLEYAYENSLKLVNVSQGYTKCSTVIIDKNSVITSDEGLFRAYKREGIDALFVSYEGIKLDGYSNGFIGGAGGMISRNTLAFYGNISDYKDYNIINEFLTGKKISVKSLSDSVLYDYGSIIPLMT